MNDREIKVKASEGKGYINFKSAKLPKSSSGKVEKTGDKSYRVYIDTDKEITIKYKEV